MISHVLQKDSWGCTVAAVAMLTGRDYDTVKAEFQKAFEDPGIGVSKGITHIDLWEWLIAEGFAWQQLWRVHYHNKPRDTWPPGPWAPLHYCEVSVTKSSPGHAVVMLEDGAVLDPLTTVPRRLTDYAAVHLVMGLWKVL